MSQNVPPRPGTSHLVNPIFQSEIKGSGVTDTLHSSIHEDLDAIGGNVTMLIKDEKEIKK